MRWSTQRPKQARSLGEIQTARYIRALVVTALACATLGYMAGVLSAVVR